MSKVNRYDNKTLSSIRTMKELKEARHQIEKALIHSKHRIKEQISFRESASSALLNVVGKLGVSSGIVSLVIKGVKLAFSLIGGRKKHKKGLFGLF